MDGEEVFCLHDGKSEIGDDLYRCNIGFEEAGWEHKNGVVKGFTEKYEVHRLVWFEPHENAESAIAKEKQMKEWKRDWKIKRIEEVNPNWNDLYERVCH